MCFLHRTGSSQKPLPALCSYLPQSSLHHVWHHWELNKCMLTNCLPSTRGGGDSHTTFASCPPPCNPHSVQRSALGPSPAISCTSSYGLCMSSVSSNAGLTLNWPPILAKLLDHLTPPAAAARASGGKLEP